MKMKQINETTLKITISMEDLEERGMEIKDFLIPQEKTEDFFYAVMDELDLPDNFKNSGLLSFRVTPRKDRLDVFVTKSELDKDLNFEDLANLGDMSQMTPDELFKTIEKSMLEKGDVEAHQKLKKVEEMVESVMSDEDSDISEEENLQDENEDLEYIHYVLYFPNIREAIQFSHVVDMEIEASELYKFSNHYYMTILIDLKDKPSYYADVMHAKLLEYSDDAKKTRAYLQEHGVRLIDGHAVSELKRVKVN